MPQTTATISLANVYKQYRDVDAVSDATMVVSKGEIIGFVGPNGAGKTTTLSMMMGFIAPSKGTIKILGTHITPSTAHKVHASIGYISGDMVLPGHMTGQDYLRFIARQNGVDKRQYTELVRRLDPVLDKHIKALSRGNKQKIALIGALQNKPRILLLDEPTSGLDPLMQQSFLETVSLEAKRGATVIMSSHILSEVAEICSRVIFVKSGRFILDKPLAAVTNRLGKHIVIEALNTRSLTQTLPAQATLLSHSGSSIRLTVGVKDMPLFMRWVATKKFEDILIENRDLDDVFLELYDNHKDAGTL